MKPSAATATAPPNCAQARFAIVCARFYADLADLLLDGARRALRDCSVGDDNVNVFEVPGCFEIPLACRNLIAADRCDAVVALGVVVRGETPHIEYVAGECTRGIMAVQLATGTPIGYGVLTTETIAQARERAERSGGDKGYAAAIAAATMLQELNKLSRI